MERSWSEKFHERSCVRNEKKKKKREKRNRNLCLDREKFFQATLTFCLRAKRTAVTKPWKPEGREVEIIETIIRSFSKNLLLFFLVANKLNKVFEKLEIKPWSGNFCQS